jgi:transcriptional regulator with XRE-family HTH domain
MFDDSTSRCTLTSLFSRSISGWGMRGMGCPLAVCPTAPQGLCSNQAVKKITALQPTPYWRIVNSHPQTRSYTFMASLTQYIAAMTQDEKDYFKVLGARVAQLRKEQALTQVQLAEALGISQQMVASYEVGRRRIPVSMLQALALALAVDIDGLLGDAAKARSKRGPAPVLARHMERISSLPKTQQKFVIQVLESVLAQASTPAATR